MLKKKAIHAIGWSAVEQVLLRLLAFALTVVMARLLTPAEFGTVAMLGIFTAVSATFVDGGFSSALIQNQECTQTDISTIFWYNLGMGGLMTGAMFVAAPWIADFFQVAVLKTIAQIISFQIVISALTSVQQTLFMKNLEFKKLMKVNVGAFMVSSGVGILLAWLGYGVWALVCQSMTQCIVSTSLIWIFASWRPSMVFSAASFRKMFAFGGFMFLSTLLNSAYLQLYSVLIGKRYSSYDLGIYNRAESTKQVPASALGTIVDRVFFPVFSRMNGDRDRLRNGLQRSVRGSMFINIPLMFGMALLAKPLMLTLYGPVWAGSAPLLSILAIGAVLWPLHILNLSAVKAVGESKRFFKIELIKKGTGICFIIIGAQYGLAGMAWAMVASSVFAFVYNARANFVLLRYGAWAQTRDFLPALASGLLMSAAVLLVSRLIDASPVHHLVILPVVGAATFFLSAFLLRIPELRQGITLVRVRLRGGEAH